MGNCVSAFPDEVAPKIRVLQASEGLLLDVELPALQSSMKVGELMLEFAPGHFIAQLNKADILASASSKRAVPLGADADAKPGAVYVLFPMPRLHTRIPPQELSSFAQLLHLHDQQLRKAARNPSKLVQVHAYGLFTAGARVAPLLEEQYKDASLEVADNDQATSSLPGSCITQSEREPIAYPDSSSFISSCHGHIGVIKPKPWAPTLQTIMESSS